MVVLEPRPPLDDSEVVQQVHFTVEEQQVGPVHMCAFHQSQCHELLFREIMVQPACTFSQKSFDNIGLRSSTPMSASLSSGMHLPTN